MTAIKKEGTQLLPGIHERAVRDDDGTPLENKLLQNIAGISYKVIENPEYLAVWVDAEDKVLFGFKTDGKTYVGDADFLMGS